MNYGLYVNQQFSEKQTKILEETASESQYFSDWLNDDEFNILRNISLNISEYPEVGKVSKYWGFGFADEPAKNISPWLLPKLKKTLGPHKIAFMAFQEAINPWRIHADIRWDEKEVPYKVLLIPLDVEPISKTVSFDDWIDTFTITFHQRNFMRSLPKSDGKISTPNTGQSHWVRSCDDPSVEQILPGYHISQEFYKKYFTHIPYEYLEGLTIDKINKWIPKSMMYWDNTALHCADDFLSQGIKTKRCFMIFTYYKM